METTALKSKKGLSVLKAMAAKGIEKRHLFLLYQSVVFNVTDYGLGLTTMAQTNLLKLDRVQNHHEVQRKPDRKWSRSNCASVPSEIPTTHSTKQ